MRTITWYSCISGIYLLLQACGSGLSTTIPLQIKPYVAEFVHQASQRGIIVDTTGLIIVYVDKLKDKEGNPVNGKFIRWSFPLLEDRIELDTTQNWWGHPYAREKVIFHELGHCLLTREHTFDTLPGGLPRSIMGITKNFTYEFMTSFRKYYLDELFDPATPNPCWITPLGCQEKESNQHIQLTPASPYQLPASPQALPKSRHAAGKH